MTLEQTWVKGLKTAEHSMKKGAIIFNLRTGEMSPSLWVEDMSTRSCHVVSVTFMLEHGVGGLYISYSTLCWTALYLVSNIPERHRGLTVLPICYPSCSLQSATHTRVRRLPGMSEGDKQMNAKTHSRVANEGAAEQIFSQSSDRKRPTWAEAAVGFCHSWNAQEIKHLGSCVGVWNCTSIMYWSTMCSSDTGPLWDLYFSTSSTVGTYLEERNCIRCWTRN